VSAAKLNINSQHHTVYVQSGPSQLDQLGKIFTFSANTVTENVDIVIIIYKAISSPLNAKRHFFNRLKPKDQFQYYP
jgi:hypothetical protein